MRLGEKKKSRNFEDATGEGNRYRVLNDFLTKLGVIKYDPAWGDLYNSDAADPSNYYELTPNEEELYGYREGMDRDQYLNALYRKAQSKLIGAVGK